MRRRLAALLGHSRPGPPPASPGEAILELQRRGPAPLRPAPAASPEHLGVAVLIPSFRRGSGGHGTIARLLEGLAARGHEVSVWLEDNDGRHAREDPELTRSSFRDFFGAGPDRAADRLLAVARGRRRRWPRAGRRSPARCCWASARRAPTSCRTTSPSSTAPPRSRCGRQDSYRHGLHCIAASPWLAELLRDPLRGERVHTSTSRPTTGSTAEPRSPSREELVVFYARAATPRRAVPLGLLALAELARRRPDTRIALFGEARPVAALFAHEDLGVLAPAELARLYGRARVGLVLSMTNPSLVGLEMMACGLPCVELASESMTATFGADGPLALAAPSPLALCEAIERLLDDEAAREQDARRRPLVDRARAAGSAPPSRSSTACARHARTAPSRGPPQTADARRGGPGRGLSCPFCAGLSTDGDGYDLDILGPEVRPGSRPSARAAAGAGARDTRPAGAAPGRRGRAGARLERGAAGLPGTGRKRPLRLHPAPRRDRPPAERHQRRRPRTRRPSCNCSRS